MEETASSSWVFAIVAVEAISSRRVSTMEVETVKSKMDHRS